jgi:type IV secretion system protein VirD4
MPLTWELPAALALGWVCVTAMLLPSARGAASWLSGAGWVWPDTGASLIASLLGPMSGHPLAALTATTAAGLPGPSVVYALVTVFEALWLVVSLLGLRVWWQRWGPGMRAGLATRSEVQKVLGRSRMRRHRAVIRPDLYAKHPETGEPQ